MYKIHLILKYLLKRRIAWVSLAAVMLCTTMVLVVISVMGGWLEMFKTSFRGLAGDIVIHTESLQGFRYYDEIIAALLADPKCHVKAAVPSIETYGLFDYGNGPVPVKVMGIQIDKIGSVNNFPASLYREHDQNPPSFDLLDEVAVPMEKPPAGLEYVPASADVRPGTIQTPENFPPALRERLRYDTVRHRLVLQGRIPEDWKNQLATLSADPAYQKALQELYTQSLTADLIPYHRLVKGKPRGLIVGVGVVGIRRNHEGNWERPGPAEYDTPCRLTVLDLSGGKIDANSQVTRPYFIVDDSHLGVWQYDSSYVYMPFAQLQKDVGLDQQNATRDDKPIVLPGRVTDIHIKTTADINPNNEAELIALRKRVEDVVHEVSAREQQARGDLDTFTREPIVETWQDTQRIWISAVENEKLLTVFLFGIMCIVAIFLIFCIFYMIVVEKTRDIGIIKSVGATSSGVAGIFLGYGLVIGVLGAGLGLLASFLIVHYINNIHDALGRMLHMKIWDPQVYLFDKIPSTMSVKDIIWIVPTAVVASVLGALIPAIRAARMNPVDALRFE